jgi:hypothetical protein
VAGLGLVLTDSVLTTPLAELSRHRLLAAYGGGAAGIVGTVGLVLASVLATAHRVVPEFVRREAPAKVPVPA